MDTQSPHTMNTQTTQIMDTQPPQIMEPQFPQTIDTQNMDAQTIDTPKTTGHPILSDHGDSIC